MNYITSKIQIWDVAWWFTWFDFKCTLLRRFFTSDLNSLIFFFIFMKRWYLTLRNIVKIRYDVLKYLWLHLQKAVAPHSSTLAWKIPWREEPGRLQSMGSWRVRHDWATSLSLFTFMHWRRKWQPTPLFLPGESQGWGSLVGCCLWGRTESDMTEAT